MMQEMDLRRETDYTQAEWQEAKVNKSYHAASIELITQHSRGDLYAQLIHKAPPYVYYIAHVSR